MSGDSAGGNLVAAMHIYMLQNNIPEFMASHLLLVCVCSIILYLLPSPFPPLPAVTPPKKKEKNIFFLIRDTDIPYSWFHALQ